MNWDDRTWDIDVVRRWSGIQTIDLTTTGRRSRAARRIEIWWFRFEERFIITGTPGPRDWYANVMADPRVVVHVAGEDVPARAVPVDDLAFRRRFFESRAAGWYATQAQLEHLVETAPMVVIEPR